MTGAKQLCKMADAITRLKQRFFSQPQAQLGDAQPYLGRIVVLAAQVDQPDLSHASCAARRGARC